MKPCKLPAKKKIRLPTKVVKRRTVLVGGPYDGKTHYMETHGTLPFSVVAKKKTLIKEIDPETGLRKEKIETLKFTGYYNFNNQWVDTKPQEVVA